MLKTIARPLIALALICICGCTHDGKQPQQQPGRSVVLWISIDGLRGDYADKYHPPFITRLMRQGAYSRQLTPVFPSLTFPSHVSEATGVKAGAHGIVDNAFYDTAATTRFSFPDEARLLESEPIWRTATRQGVRTAVYDWPLSYRKQLPPNAVVPAYSDEKFTSSLTPDQRIDHLLDTYRNDPAPDGQPLRLLMTYFPEVDKAGHKFGPDSPQLRDALLKTDAVLERFVNSTVETFNRKMNPDRGDRLYFLVTTDHGMLPIRTFVSLPKLLGDLLPPNARIENGSTVANLFLTDLPSAARAAAAQRIAAKLANSPYLRAWTRDFLPTEYGYLHPTRTGDVILSANPGYAFTSRKGSATSPTTFRAGLDPAENKANHGYRPLETPEMLGLLLLWSPQAQTNGVDLGTVDSLQIHPTVAHMLGIQPAPRATAAPLKLPF